MNASERSYVVSVIIPAVERDGLTVKTQFGELQLCPDSKAVSSFLAELRQEMTRPQPQRQPHIPF
jgi:hypothetical protein